MPSVSVLAVAGVVGAALLLCLLLHVLRIATDPLSNLPGPRWAWLFSHNPKLISNGFGRHRTPHEVMEYVEQYQYPRFLRYSGTQVLVTDADIIQSLTKGFESDPRKHRHFEGVQMWVGKSVFTLTDKFDHKARRQILSSSFSMTAIRNMQRNIHDAGIVPFLRNLRTVAAAETPEGRIINISDDFHRLFLDVIGDIALGGSFHMLEHDGHPLPKMVSFLFQGLGFAALFPWAFEMFNFIPQVTRFKNAVQYVHTFSINAIENRRKENRENPEHEYTDLLQSLINCADPDSGVQLTNEEIASDIIAFIMAGSDTTSNTCSWFVYLMTQHHHVLAKLREEIDSVSSDPSEVPSYDQVKDLPYFNAVINETLRLHPAAALASLRVVEYDRDIGGQYFPAGTGLSWCVYVMHRSKLYWSRPNDFYPERFLGDNPEPSHPVAFMPFSLGSRNCIGRNLAMVELRMILPMLVKFFDFEYVGPPMEAINRFVYFPKHGVRVIVRTREI